MGKLLELFTRGLDNQSIRNTMTMVCYGIKLFFPDVALIDDSTMTTLHVTGKLWVCSFGCEPTHPLVCNCETGWVFFILIVRSTNDDDDDEPCRLIEY